MNAQLTQNSFDPTVSIQEAIAFWVYSFAIPEGKMAQKR